MINYRNTVETVIRGIVVLGLMYCGKSAAQVYEATIGDPIALGKITDARLVARAANGDLYVYDASHRLITKFSAAGTPLLRWGGAGDDDGKFGADVLDLEVDANGDVYVVDTESDRIQKFSSAGVFITKWGIEGTDDGEFQHPNSIGFDSNDDVYVSDNDRVQKFTDNGAFILKWGTHGTGNGQFEGAWGLSVDDNDDVYVCDWGGRIQKFSSTGTYLLKWGTYGQGAGQFFLPFAIELDGSQNVFVSDLGNAGRIQKFTSTGSLLATWNESEPGSAIGLVFNFEIDPSDVLILPVREAIVRQSVAGAFISKQVTTPSMDGQLYYPGTVVADQSENVIVTDNRYIHKFTKAGLYVSKFGGNGTGDGQFTRRGDIALDAQGDMYVVDANRIQKLSSNGSFLSKWGSAGTGNGQFNTPTGIALDHAGNVYVVDQSNHRIQKFTATGSFISKWGSQGTADGQFQSPVEIAIDANDNVFVTDGGNSRIQKFSSSGAFLTKWGVSNSDEIIDPNEFAYPFGISIDAGGDVYVVDNTARVQRFNSSGSYLATWHLNESGIAEFGLTGKLHIDHAGGLYAVDNVNQGVRRYRLPNRIFSVTPVAAPAGSPATVEGIYFRPDVASNMVYVGGSKAEITAATTTTLTFDVPHGGTYNPISVTTNGLTSTSVDPFVLTFPSNGLIDALSFAPKVSFGSSTGILDIVMGDFDTDGRLDVAYCHAGGVSVMRNLSTVGSIVPGTLAPSINVASGSASSNLAMGDIDCDGKLDIAVINNSDGKITLIRNTSTAGTISFATQVDISTTETSHSGIDLADIDGDGRIELLVTAANIVKVFRNVGQPGAITSASMEEPVIFPMSTSSGTLSVKAADLDQDRKPELICGVYGHVEVFKNLSLPSSFTSASFAAPVTFAVGTAIDVSVSDLDGDGKPDLVTANNFEQNISVLRNTGTAGVISTGTFAPRLDLSASFAPKKVAIGDLTGDGKPDMVIANQNTGIYTVYSNKSVEGILNGSSFSKFDFPNSSTSSAIGDIDNDGRPEIIMTSPGSIAVFRNTTEPGEQPANLLFSSVTTSGFNATMAVAAGSPDGYIVIGSRSVVPSIDPIDGIEYSVNDLLGSTSGQDVRVINAGQINSFVISGALPATTYHFKIYSYNGSGSNINYYLETPLQGSQSTLSSVPASPPTNLVFSNRTPTSITVSFTAATGTPDGYLVIRTAGVAYTAEPAVGTAYSPGDEIGSAIVAYSGAATTFVDSGLDPSTTYDYRVYSFNGSGTGTNYFYTVLAGSAATFSAEPTQQPTALLFSSVQKTSMTLNWTAPATAVDGYLALRKSNSSPLVSEAPIDGTTYLVGSPSGTSTVAHAGVATSFTDVSLAEGTDYHYDVYAYLGSGNSINYLTVAPLEGNKSTASTYAAEPTAQPTGFDIDNGSEAAHTVTFSAAAGTPAGYIALRRESSSPGVGPSDGTVYAIGDDIAQSKVAYVGSSTSFNETGLLNNTIKYFYDIFSFNGSGATINYLAGSPLEGSVDNSLPAITNNTQAAVAPGLPLLITVQTSDSETGVSQVQVYYSALGTAIGVGVTFQLTHGTGNTWTGEIPATDIHEMGVEYRVDAKNGHGFTEYHVNKGVIQYTDKVLDLPAGMPFTKNQRSYRIVSVPFVVPAPSSTVNGIFGTALGAYDESVWRAYRYENRILSKLGGSSPVAPGKGYWLISTREPSANITIDGTSVPVTVVQPFEITLSQGWNQIGNPYLFDISWNDVRAANSTLSASLGLKAKSYNGNVIELDEIKKFEGAFISFTGTDGTKLKIPTTKNASINGRLSAPSMNSLVNKNWEVRFELSNDEQTYSLGALGMHEDARNDVDQHDDFNLPRFAGFLELRHEKSFADMTFTKDVVSSQSSHVWNFTTESSSAGAQSLAWDNSNFGDDGPELWLMDLETSMVWDMRMANSVTVNTRATRKWRVAFGSVEFVTEATLPSVSSLITAYPNPFRDEMSIETAVVEPGLISIDVLEVTGRPVRLLIDGYFTKGRRLVTWNGADAAGLEVPPGLYLVRMTSEHGVRYLRIIKN